MESDIAPDAAKTSRWAWLSNARRNSCSETAAALSVRNQESDRHNEGSRINMDPRTIVEGIEQNVSVPAGTGDRFAGYAVIGLPFTSGHVLSLRRLPASSVGPGYTSVWHRDPEGRWTFYSTVAPEQGCSRYFGSEIEKNVVAPIHIEWLGPAQFLVAVTNALTWEVTLAELRASRAMNTAARWLPESWWRKPFVLSVMGAASRFVLGTGRINLSGTTPNGHWFVANPRQLWLVKSSRAIIRGVDVGAPGPLVEQAHLRDFLIPQRGVFAVVSSFLNADPVTPSGRIRFRRLTKETHATP